MRPPRRVTRGAVPALAALGLVAVVMVLMASPVRAAPVPGPAARVPEPAADADLLRLAWWTDVGFPTPFAASTVGPGGIVRLSLIYDTLVWKDAHGAIPWLAERWRVSPDGLRWTFVLRPDVVWHDGRPLRPRDVQFTFEYYRKHPFVWADLGIVAAVHVGPARSVTFVLREPFAPFLEDVAGVVPIIPEHVWSGIEDPRRTQSLDVAVGSGPYRLADYRPGAGDYRFLANPRYFRGAVRPQEIRYTLLPQERQLLAVQSGQIDVAMADAHDVVGAVAGHNDLRSWATGPLTIARLLFNLERSPTDRKVVRAAVAHAINRTQLGNLVTRGPAEPGNPGVVPPADPWYTPRVRSYPHDPARTRALLAEAGLAPLTLELVASPSPVVPLLQQALRDAGIELVARTVDARTRAALVGEGRFQAALTTHIGAGGDPDYLRRWFDASEANQFARSAAFGHPDYQRLAALQARALDASVRRRHVHAMQAMLAEELPTLPLFYRRFYWVYDSRRFTPAPARGGLMQGIPLVDNKLAFLAP